MNTKHEDGGSVFPPTNPYMGGTGISLRDWIASQASEGDIKEMMMSEKDYRNCRTVQYSRQQARYRHADAMLAARS